MQTFFRNWVLGLAVALLPLTSMAALLPTPHQVVMAEQAGNFQQAQQMMAQVLAAHPNSAKAHFVEAQLLARSGQRSAAAQELRKAESIAPGLPGISPAAVHALKASLAHGAPQAMHRRSPGATLALVLALLGGAILLIMLIRSVFARRQAVAAPYPGYNPYAAGGMMGGYPGPMGPSAGGGLGSSLGSGLATGLGIGAGMAAGEALANGLIGGSNPAAPSNDSWGDSSGGIMGGNNDFGIGDSSSWGDGGSDFGAGGGDSW
ncbi:MAG: hypothetical protein M0037_13545 [Betaproteobacteria bacterium]|nr:hypothetical protein [Betaproteobacteria bacterium]